MYLRLPVPLYSKYLHNVMEGREIQPKAFPAPSSAYDMYWCSHTLSCPFPRQPSHGTLVISGRTQWVSLETGIQLSNIVGHICEHCVQVTNCVWNAAAYNLLQLWRCPVMKCPLHVRPLIFHWILVPCTNVSASSPIFRPAGDPPCPPVSLGGKRHSRRDELTPFHNCKMASKDISHPPSLDGRASCQSLHTQLLPMCWLHCEVPRTLMYPMLPSCSYYHLPAPPLCGKEFPSLCDVCLKHGKTGPCCCGVLSNPVMWDCSITGPGSQLCLNKALAPMSRFSACENSCWLLCVFKNCREWGQRPGKAKRLICTFQCDG